MLKTLYPALFNTASRKDTSSGRVPTEMTVSFGLSGIRPRGRCAEHEESGQANGKSYRLVSRHIPRLTNASISKMREALCV